MEILDLEIQGFLFIAADPVAVAEPDEVTVRVAGEDVERDGLGITTELTAVV
jgi:hypothetical protein